MRQQLTVNKHMNRMPNISAELPAVNTEWLQPETFEKLLRYVPSIVSSLAKLKQSLSKRGGPKRDLKQLGEDIDALAKTLEKVCEVIHTHVNLSTKITEASVPFITIVGKRILELVQWAKVTKSAADHINKSTRVLIAHETRIKALEAAIEAGKGKRTSGKKSPALTADKPKKKKRAKKA
jgi:hypothetical protein